MRVGETLGAAHAQVLALAPGVVPTSLSLDPVAGYLLSRIDGRTTWGTLRQIGAMPAHEVDRHVERWLKEGVLVASSATAIRTPPRADGAQSAPPKASAPPSANAKPSAPPQTQSPPAAPPKPAAPGLASSGLP